MVGILAMPLLALPLLASAPAPASTAHAAARPAPALPLVPPLLPPPPPADIDALKAAAPTDDATAKRQLLEAGVPADKRTAAADFLAKAKSKPACVILLDAIQECAGACGATRDLADLLAAAAPAGAADADFTKRLVAAATDAAGNPALRMAAYRALVAIPADKRPAEAKDFAIRTVTMKAVLGGMKYDPAEIRAKPGEAMELVLDNTDTLLHNFILVMPGKLTEVGVAGEKLGETAEGKARQFVPDLPSVIEVMGLVDPGKTGHLFLFTPAKVGTYPFVCTYPGHWRMMNGKLKVAKPE